MDSKASLLDMPGVREVMERDWEAIMENIQDPSTPAEQKRQITVTYDIAPFPDRRGAQITFSCKGKLASVEAATSTVFLARKSGGGIQAFFHDPAQERLFAEEPTASDSKQ